jgi:S1-C subfamily serine protease
MSLADTVARCRSGVFQIGFFDAKDHKIGGGTAFLCNGLLVTNNHVFIGYRAQNVVRVGIRRDDAPQGHFFGVPAQGFEQRLVTGSQEQSYDYAVFRVSEVVEPDDHHFTLEPPGDRRIGEPIALLGFPLEHENMTCHQGIISSRYQSGATHVIQIDASVNAGNSGGPLIDPETGVAIGIVTRKATGLSRIFDQLRQSAQNNLQALQATNARISIGGIDAVQAIRVSQAQMLGTFDEIERQANVGIGYAFSSEHVLAEECMRPRT